MIVSFILTLSKLYIWCKKGERCQLLLGLKELSNVQLDFVYLDYRNKCNNFKFNCFTFYSPCRDGFPVGQSGTLSKVYRLTPLLNNNRVWYKGCLLSYTTYVYRNKCILVFRCKVIQELTMRRRYDFYFSSPFHLLPLTVTCPFGTNLFLSQAYCCC